ncbi:MAG: hypothetical protein ACREMY_31020 [bacterium]
MLSSTSRRCGGLKQFIDAADQRGFEFAVMSPGRLAAFGAATLLERFKALECAHKLIQRARVAGAGVGQFVGFRFFFLYRFDHEFCRFPGVTDDVFDLGIFVRYGFL